MAMSPRLLRPLATGFNPRSIAGLVAWWDASDSSTVTLNGTRVSQWSNKIAGAPAMTQATEANQPLYAIAGRNGKNVIQIDSTSRWLSNTTTTQVGFFAAVIAPTGTESFGSSLSFVGKHGLIRNGTSNNAYFSPSSLFPQAAYRKNGAFTTVYGTDWAVFSQGGTVDTRAARIDVDGAGSTRSTCSIAEILIYGSAPTTTERQKIEGYLAWKWGLQAQLPYDHPYAASFPGFGSQAVPTDADTLTYLAAVKAADGTGVEVGVANAVDDFVKGTKADGTWDAIKASCILAGARTLTGALVPLKGAAPTNNNFAENDYNRETGLVGDGSTTYLDSGRNNNADPQDSSHIAVYASSLDTNGAVVGVHLGAGGSGVTGSTMLVEQGASVLRVRSRSSTLTSSSQNEAVGFMAVARPDASNISVRSDGGTSSHAVASEAPANANYYVFGTNNSGLANATDARLAFYSLGESLDLAALDTRVSALITAIGAAI